MLHNMAHLKRARAYGNSAAAAKDRSGKRAVERSRYNQNHEECGHNDWWDEPALGCVGPRPIVSACDCRGCVDLTFSGIDHTYFTARYGTPTHQTLYRSANGQQGHDAFERTSRLHRGL